MPPKKQPTAAAAQTPINVKAIEIISNLVAEQNKQLLYIICKEEFINYKKVKHLLTSRYEILENLRSKCT